MERLERERTQSPDTGRMRRQDGPRSAAGSGGLRERLRRFLRGTSYEEGRDLVGSRESKSGSHEEAKADQSLLEGFLSRVPFMDR